MLAAFLVGRDGFEPSYAMRTDLQSVSFNHSDTCPGVCQLQKCTRVSAWKSNQNRLEVNGLPYGLSFGFQAAFHQPGHATIRCERAMNDGLDGLTNRQFKTFSLRPGDHTGHRWNALNGLLRQW